MLLGIHYGNLWGVRTSLSVYYGVYRAYISAITGVKGFAQQRPATAKCDREKTSKGVPAHSARPTAVLRKPPTLWVEGRKAAKRKLILTHIGCFPLFQVKFSSQKMLLSPYLVRI